MCMRCPLFSLQSNVLLRPCYSTLGFLGRILRCLFPTALPATAAAAGDSRAPWEPLGDAAVLGLLLLVAVPAAAATEPRLATELEFEGPPFWSLFFRPISWMALLCSTMHTHELVKVHTTTSTKAGLEDLRQAIVQVIGAKDTEEIAVVW